MVAATRILAAMLEPFDTVVVADFRGDAAATFTARTLIFLAGWRRFAGAASGFPLHLVAIGDPPEVVKTAARRHGIPVSVKRPLSPSGRATINKLRGFEVEGESDALLLLDVDMVPLGDLAPLADPESDLMMHPASVPRVPQRCWDRIYEALELVPPRRPWPCLVQELSWGLPPETLVRDGEGKHHSTFPYFNTGLVYVRRRHAERFATLWRDHLARIESTLPGNDSLWLGKARDDQAGASTAAYAMIEAGLRFKAPADRFHVRWQHLLYRRVAVSEIRLFHAMRLARHPAWAPGAEAQVALYGFVLIETLLRFALREWRKVGRASSLLRKTPAAMRDAWRIGRLINDLHLEARGGGGPPGELLPDVAR